MVGRIRFALERLDLPRHRSHVAQLFSLGHTTRMNIGDIPTKVLLLLLFVVIALAATLAVALMRFFYRVSGHERVYKNGIVMTEGGIEYLGFPFTGTRKKTFDEIDSVELSPYFKVAISALCFRYGLNTNRVPPNFFGDILVIGFKHPNPFRYLFFCAPKDAAAIYEQIKSQIGHESRVA